MEPQLGFVPEAVVERLYQSPPGVMVRGGSPRRVSRASSSSRRRRASSASATGRPREQHRHSGCPALTRNEYSIEVTRIQRRPLVAHGLDPPVA
jgi:hypothetical protein